MEEARHRNCTLYDCTSTECPEEANPETEQTGARQGPGEGDQELTADGDGASCRADGNVLELDSGDDCTTLNFLMPQDSHFKVIKMVKSMPCVFYHQKERDGGRDPHLFISVTRTLFPTTKQSREMCPGLWNS